MSSWTLQLGCWNIGIGIRRGIRGRIVLQMVLAKFSLWQSFVSDYHRHNRIDARLFRKLHRKERNSRADFRHWKHNFWRMVRRPQRCTDQGPQSVRHIPNNISRSSDGQFQTPLLYRITQHATRHLHINYIPKRRRFGEHCRYHEDNGYIYSQLWSAPCVKHLFATYQPTCVVACCWKNGARELLLLLLRWRQATQSIDSRSTYMYLEHKVVYRYRFIPYNDSKIMIRFDFLLSTERPKRALLSEQEAVKWSDGLMACLRSVTMTCTLSI